MDKKEIEQIEDLKFRVRDVERNLRNCYGGIDNPCATCSYVGPGCINRMGRDAADLLEDLDHLLAAMPNPRKEVLLVKAEYHLRTEELEAIRHKILREVREGVVLLPKGFEPWLIPEDVEVRVDGK